jgi:hypothetical protein
MGKDAPVVYEGFLGDAWNSIKSKATGAIDTIKTKTGELTDDAKEKAAEVVDKTNKAIESETSNMAKLEKAGTPDAWKLFKAMNGMGTDEKAVREVIDRRSGDLKVLDQEYQKLMNTMAEVGTNIKSAGAEVVKGATSGAKIGGGAMAAVAVGATIMTFLGLASLPLSAALLAPIEGAVVGAKIGAAVKGIKELDQWSDQTLTAKKGLVEMLKEEGMEEEAEKVRGALSESNIRLAKSILKSSRTYRQIKWRG